MLVRSLPRRFENTLYTAWEEKDSQASKVGVWRNGVEFLLACWPQQLRVEVEVESAS